MTRPSHPSRSRDSAVRQAFSFRRDGVGRRVAGGAGYQFLGIGLRTALTLGSTAVLARLLTPADFGYVAMATVVTEFGALLSTFGFANVLIQRRTINRLQLDTLFWATLALEGLLAFLIFAVSLAAERLFSDPHVGPLLKVMSVTFVISGLSAVPSVILMRQMRFRAIFWVNMSTGVLRSLAAIVFGLAGLGMWSLVLGSLIGGVFGTVFHFVAAPYRPRWRCHWSLIARTWRTSTSYLGNTALYYANTNLDLFLIGRQLGPSALGYYQNARSLTDEIRGRIAVPIQHVLFPAFSALQDDKHRFQTLVLRSGRLLAAVVIPVSLAVSANAEELVAVLYGSQWRPMVPIMVLFGLSAGLRASTAIASALFNATDRVGLSFRYNALSTALLIAGVLFAMPHGINAVAIAVALTSLYALVSLNAAMRLVGMGLTEVLKMLSPPAAASLVMWTLIAVLRSLEWSNSAAVQLVVHSAAGAVVYLLVLAFIAPWFRQQIRAGIEMALKRFGV